jgi:hypothetical protein
MFPRRLRHQVLSVALGASLLALSAAAEEPSLRPPETGPLDGLARDLDLNLQSTPGEATVRVPLRARDWTLLGRVQPYAALTPRTLSPDLLDASGLTAPARESRIDDLSNGVGLGGGVSWRLSDRLGVFGEYLFVPRGRTGPASAPSVRRDGDPPELKGGMSIRF